MAKSKAYMSEYRKSIAMQKQQAQPAQKEEPEERKQTVTRSNAITSSNQILSRESYDIFDSETDRYIKTSSGSKLRDSIAHETLSYDKKSKAWITKKGKYIIRKKR